MAKYFEIRINGKEIGGPFGLKKKWEWEKIYNSGAKANIIFKPYLLLYVKVANLKLVALF